MTSTNPVAVLPRAPSGFFRILVLLRPFLALALLGCANATLAQIWSLAAQQVGNDQPPGMGFTTILTLPDGTLRAAQLLRGHHQYVDLTPAGVELRRYQDARLSNLRPKFNQAREGSVLTSGGNDDEGIVCSIQKVDAAGQERFLANLPRPGSFSSQCSAGQTLPNGDLAVLAGTTTLFILDGDSGVFTSAKLAVPPNVQLKDGWLAVWNDRVMAVGALDMGSAGSAFWVGLFERNGSLVIGRALGAPIISSETPGSVHLRVSGDNALLVWDRPAGGVSHVFSARVAADLMIVTTPALLGQVLSISDPYPPATLLQAGGQYVLRYPQDLLSFGSAGTFQLQQSSEAADFDSQGRLWIGRSNCDQNPCRYQLLRRTAQLSLIDEVPVGSVTSISALAAVDSGAMIVSGNTADGPALIRLDSGGAPVWQRAPLFESASSAESLLRSGDGAYLATYREVASAGARRHLLRLDGRGRILWDTAAAGTPVASNPQGVWLLRDDSDEGLEDCCGLRFVSAAGVASAELPINRSFASTMEVRIAEDGSAWLALWTPTRGQISHVTTSGNELSTRLLSGLPVTARLKLSGNQGHYFIGDGPALRRYDAAGQLQWSVNAITGYRPLQDDSVLVYGNPVRRLDAAGNALWTVTPVPVPFQGDYLAEEQDLRAWVIATSVLESDRRRLLLQRLDMSSGVITMTESDLPAQPYFAARLVLDNQGEALLSMSLEPAEPRSACAAVFRFAGDHLSSASCLNPAWNAGRSPLLTWVNDANQVLIAFTSRRALEIARAAVALLNDLQIDGFE